MVRTSYIQWDDVRLVLQTKHIWLDFYISSWLKQQSAGRHAAPLRHIILILSQPVFVLTPQSCVLSRDAKNTNFNVLGRPHWGLKTWSTTPKASMLTSTWQDNKVNTYLHKTYQTYIFSLFSISNINLKIFSLSTIHILNKPICTKCIPLIATHYFPI